MMPTIPDLIRAFVLLEIVVVIVFSIASMTFYIKRLLQNRDLETGLSWHVVVIGTVFLVLTIDRFEWVYNRLGEPDLLPRGVVYLFVFAAAGCAQYLLYARQLTKLGQGE